jgi:arylsulfatase A-like enzyme/cytochrome c-type biogenesis protein CcmH/NrfG
MKSLQIVLFFLLSGTLSAGQTSSRKSSRPDIFLVTIDTLRADHVHCFGYDKISTPSLDALAADGTRFSQAFTPSPITNTSHATILTGLLPSAHGVTDFGSPLASTHPTMAEMLKQQGYVTAAFIGAVILDSKTLAPGLDRGFDFYDNFPQHPSSKSRWGRVERRGMDVVQHAENWLNKQPKGPRFVWLHLYDPHDPYEPPAPFSQTYKDRLYDGEIAYADSALGSFIRYLKQHAWYENAIVVAVGDHGEGLGEHHEDTHGIFLYDSTTHVPLIIKLPRREAKAREVSAQVRTTDLLPTVLDLAGAPSIAKLDGESLKPYLAGTDKENRIYYGETDYPLRFGWSPLRSVRERGFKFIEAPRPELYDLGSDPHELKNRYTPWDETVQKMRAELSELRTRLPKPQPSAGAVGKGTTDELHALGYLGASDALSSTNVPEPSLLPDPKDRIEEQNLLHTAMLASDDGRTTEARLALEKVLQLNPKSPTGLLQLGQLELAAGNPQKASDYLGRAQESRPEDAIAAFDYARALELTGDLTRARQALEETLRLNPSQFAARLLMGKVCLRLDDARTAEDQLEAALLLNPNSSEAQLLLARAQIAQKAFSDAASGLEALTKSQPANPDIYDLLSEAYAGLGKGNMAQEASAKAARMRKIHRPK